MKTPASSLVTVCLVMGWGCQGQEQEQEFDLELCRNRGSHWRSNQHDYIFSGILEQFRGRDKVSDRLVLGNTE